MLMFLHVNHIAVFAATLVTMGIGMFWYSPSGFGNAWMALVNLTEEDAQKTDMKKVFPVALLSHLVGRCVLAVLLQLMGIDGVGSALFFGVLLLLVLPAREQNYSRHQHMQTPRERNTSQKNSRCRRGKP